MDDSQWGEDRLLQHLAECALEGEESIKVEWDERFPGESRYALEIVKHMSQVEAGRCADRLAKEGFLEPSLQTRGSTTFCITDKGIQHARDLSRPNVDKDTAMWMGKHPFWGRAREWNWLIQTIILLAGVIVAAVSIKSCSPSPATMQGQPPNSGASPNTTTSPANNP